MSTLLEEALRDVGYTEDPPGSNKTKFAAMAGHPNGFPWCATWVVSVARRARVQLPNESAYTPTMALGFKSAGLWSQIPTPGSLAFFDFPDASSRIQHVGIVVSSDPVKATVTCVEGNTSPGRLGSQVNGGGVYIRTRPMSLVVGFGHLAPTPLPPASAPIVTPYPEDHMKSIDLTIDTDDQGKGYRDLPDVPARTVVNVMCNTANPTDGGYKPIPDVARIALDGGSRVVVEEAVPKGRIDVTVWVAG